MGFECISYAHVPNYVYGLSHFEMRSHYNKKKNLKKKTCFTLLKWFGFGLKYESDL